MKRKMMLLAVLLAFAVALAVPAMVPTHSEAHVAEVGGDTLAYVPHLLNTSYVAEPVCPPNAVPPC